MGTGSEVTVDDFIQMYGEDPFYSWIGLDNKRLYAAHKAAGGMTSIYRQIGIGAETLFRKVLQDEFGLNEEESNWSFEYTASGGSTKSRSLDARIDVNHVESSQKADVLMDWLHKSADKLGVDDNVKKALKGVVFEVRQGYKSKDSKRQNADLENGSRAYSNGYLPCMGILSLQIDSDVLYRYRNGGWMVLIGEVEDAPADISLYRFCEEVAGYDLAGFFQENKETIRTEVDHVLQELLRAE
jgi:hypothetical protein